MLLLTPRGCRTQAVSTSSEERRTWLALRFPSSPCGNWVGVTLGANSPQLLLT